MGEMTPVCGGAKYRDVSCGDSHGDVIRVKSVWIDEDGRTLVQVFTEKEHVSHPRSRSIDADDFMERIDDEIIRVNSDHEAWEWRQEYTAGKAVPSA